VPAESGFELSVLRGDVLETMHVPASVA